VLKFIHPLEQLASWYSVIRLPDRSLPQTEDILVPPIIPNAERILRFAEVGKAELLKTENSKQKIMALIYILENFCVQCLNIVLVNCLLTAYSPCRLSKSHIGVIFYIL